MTVQVSFHPDKSNKKEELLKSSMVNLSLSGIERDNIEILSEILTGNKTEAELSIKTINGKNYFTLPYSDLLKITDEFSKEGLNNLSSEIKRVLSNYKTYDKLSVKAGNIEFQQPVIMGILNVTPDSFSDSGKYFNKDDAVKYAVEMFDNGADIVDVGGESTKPGSDRVPEDEEKRRVIPVVEEILKRKPNALISIDTTKSSVAREACQAGAKIINDISGLSFDKKIAEIANEFSATLVIMHIKGTPKTMQANPLYDDLIFEIYDFLFNQTEIARTAGVENIIADPGIGFGKSVENNFEILRRLSDFKCLGYPILIGLSRKSFLGKSLNLDLNERDTATSIAETIAIRNGAKIIRTHNISNAVKTKKLLNFIYAN